MKFESFYIECKNKDQRNELSKNLEDVGFKYIESEDSDLTIGCYRNEFYQYLNHRTVYGSPTFDFEYFMKNHMNDMIKKIHQAKKELGLNNSELSLKMGKSRPYIAKMLNQPQSEKVQNKVIAEIDRLIDGNLYDQYLTEKQDKFNKEFKKDLRDLHEKIISHLSDGAKNPDLFISNLDDEFKLKDKEISDLKKIIESKDLAISGLIKQNDEAKKIHDKDVNTLVEVEGNLIGAKIDLDRTKVELDYFVNKYNQSELVVNSLKSKIKRERIIILIVIAILTALFFLKGAVGG